MKDYNHQWNRYREWAETHVEPDPRSPAQIMADVDWLYRAYPEDVRRTDPDPEKTGVQSFIGSWPLSMLSMSAHASLESALAGTIDELNAASIPYMLIGGLAGGGDHSPGKVSVTTIRTETPVLGHSAHAAGLAGLTVFSASIAARSSRTLCRRAIFCLRSRLKRAMSPQVLDILFSSNYRGPRRGALWGLRALAVKRADGSATPALLE